ncbi:glycosyltransferase [Pedobacter sp.]|uniref:glycosyltransferase n=1 Tax=Pedobacter sp. TaxID=1411316 RepID=UPI0031E2E36F
MEKLRVLFLPAWYPSKFNKVGGVFVREHAKAINQQVKLAVFHVCEHTHLRKLHAFEEVTEDDILTYRYYYKKFSAKWLRPLNVLIFFVVAFVGYQKVKNKFNPNLNHVHVLTRMGLVALLAKLFYRIPFVITEHWSRYLPERNTYKGILRKIITKLVVKKSLGMSVVTEDLKNAMLTFGLNHQNFPVIPNVVDTDLFKPDCQSKDDFIFLHVSGLNDHVKNVTGILRAFQKLLLEIEKSKKVKLVIVGDDDLERPILESYSDEIGLKEFVSFVGKKYSKDLVQEYQRADAFVLFSNFENQPCVILEAMSCGLPIISSAVGGVAEVVSDEIGLLVPAKNEDALKQAMLDMYYNNEKYNSAIIRRNAEENFAYLEVCSKLINFYNISLNKKT